MKKMSPHIPLSPSPHRKRMIWVALVMGLAALGRWLYQGGDPLQPMTISAGPLQPLGSVLPASLGPAEHPSARSLDAIAAQQGASQSMALEPPAIGPLAAGK
jgi:hypothetical protein